MHRSNKIALGVFTAGWIPVSVVQTPVTVTLASLVTLFYLVQVFDKITIVLHQTWPMLFRPVALCYVCGSVAGTWLVTGIVLGLLPASVIVYLAGLSTYAIAADLPPALSATGAYRVKLGVVLAAFTTTGALLVSHAYTGLGMGVALALHIGGIATKIAAELVDYAVQQLSDMGVVKYRNVEENVALLVFILAGTAAITVL